VAARHERARARAVHALGARSRLPIVGLGIEQAPDLELALRHALDADRARPHLARSAGATLLPGDGLRSPSECRGAFRREPLPCGVAGVSVLVRVHALSPSYWCSHAHGSRSAPESGPERWYRSLDRRGVCL